MLAAPSSHTFVGSRTTRSEAGLATTRSNFGRPPPTICTAGPLRSVVELSASRQHSRKPLWEHEPAPTQPRGVVQGCTCLRYQPRSRRTRHPILSFSLAHARLLGKNRFAFGQTQDRRKLANPGFAQTPRVCVCVRSVLLGSVDQHRSVSDQHPSFHPTRNPGLGRKAIVPASLIIAALGAVSAYTFVLIGRSCAETGAESYEQSWARTVGQKSAWMPAGACVATCFAGCLAFTIIIGDSFSSLAKTFGAPAAVANRSNVIMAISATVLLPLSLLKSERILRLVCA